MAKFVLTTWAACLARQKPVSTRAKPACMKMTRTAPMTIHSRLICWPSEATGSASWAPATAGNASRAVTATPRPVEGPPGGRCPAERPGARTRGHAAFLSGALRWGRTPLSDLRLNLRTALSRLRVVKMNRTARTLAASVVRYLTAS